MEIIKCGTVTNLKLGGIQGTITATSIRFDKVNYGFSYFYNGEYKNIWLHETEFTIEENNKQLIGFKN